MSKTYHIQTEKGPLRLRKSKKLAGIRLREGLKGEKLDFLSKEWCPYLGGFQLVELEDGGRLDERLDEIRARQEVKVGTHAYYAEGSDRPIVPTGDLYLYFEPGVSKEEQSVVMDEFALELIGRRSDTEIVVRVTAQSPNPIKIAQALTAISMVRLAEPDFDTFLDNYDVASPTDHLMNQQWSLRNFGFVPDASVRMQPGADAKVVDAWNRLGDFGSASVTIAVIDNGFDLTHPDLRSKVFRPFDIWNNSNQVVQGDGRYVHGTPVASLALAGQNGNGMVGVAPNARFMPISGTSFASRDTELMFDYCINNGADIISCSWGSIDPINRLNSVKESAIARAARQGRNGKGCIILYAVGNDGQNQVNFYAAHPDVIGVAASTSLDQHAAYSNEGMEVDVCAPSNGHWPLIAARAWWDPGDHRQQGEFKYWVDGRNRGNNYMHFGGTSGATPIVAGVCALLLSANPALSAREVKEILQQTADKIGQPAEYFNGHSRRYGFGRVNADRAVAEALRRKHSSSPSTGVGTGSSSSGGLFQVDVTEKPRSGWGVQAGAFSSFDNVMDLANRFKRQFGHPVYVHTSGSGAATLYKIIVGAFKKIQDARQLHDRMEAQGVNGFVKNLADL